MLEMREMYFLREVMANFRIQTRVGVMPLYLIGPGFGFRLILETSSCRFTVTMLPPHMFPAKHMHPLSVLPPPHTTT